MDSAQWTQDFGVAKSMAENMSAPINACTRSSAASTERKIRPQKDQAVNCPRCNSTNTKFCYYNNYSLTQPRYFCKTCRRYWTEGGTLRNVPVGGGSRKNKKSINVTSATSSSSSPLKLPDLNPNSQFSSHDHHHHHHQLHQNPKIHDQGHDLNLGFHGPPPSEYGHGMIPQFLEFPKTESSANAIVTKDHVLNMSSTTSSSNPISALNFLRLNGARGLNSFIPMAPNALENNALFASSAISFPFQECKPSLGFSIDGAGRFAGPNGVPQDSSVDGSLMFTLGGTKRSDQDDQNDQVNKGQENSNGFWNGILGGGNW